MPEISHGVSVEQYGEFEVVTVSFAVPKGYGREFQDICQNRNTTCKEFIAKTVRGIVVCGDLRQE